MPITDVSVKDWKDSQGEPLIIPNALEWLPVPYSARRFSPYDIRIETPFEVQISKFSKKEILDMQTDLFNARTELFNARWRVKELERFIRQLKKELLRFKPCLVCGRESTYHKNYCPLSPDYQRGTKSHVSRRDVEFIAELFLGNWKS